MRVRYRSTALLALLLLLTGCARFSYVEHRLGYKRLLQPFVRVKIMETSRLMLEAGGPFELYCTLPDGSTTDYFSNSDLVIETNGSDISVRQTSGLPLERALRRVVAVPNEGKFWLVLNGIRFRGIADIIIERDSLTVINALYMEDYLKGVLPPEIGKHGAEELEALKAQAVASRTYALSRFRHNPAKAYDMVAEVADQVYTGMATEDHWTNSAIEATRGEVLLAGDQPITAYYHSTCGGATDNIEDVWDKQPRSYLKGRNDSTYCQWSKFYNWEFTWSREQLDRSISKYLKDKRRLRGDGIEVTDIKVVDRLPTGRIRVLELNTSAGKFLLFKDQIRWAFIRPDRDDAILPSTNFQIEIDRNHAGTISRVTATGRGNGHGVGMCQCGAIGRSRAGQNYREILSIYYAGALISRRY